uniref:C-type lectin domain-containing protein n=1 Tax=Mastacembelus armatus TaxID=205130 RepID=A0A3Q3MM55_9TELE
TSTVRLFILFCEALELRSLHSSFYLLFFHFYAICVSYKAITFVLSSSHPQCDLANGWTQYGSNCYKLKADTRKSWAAARYDCVQDGGDLVSIASAGEEQYVTGVIAQSPTGISLWMGGHDSITEGGWEWTDGSPFRYIHWNAGNPDDYYGEDCLSILINKGHWNDDNCENKRGYICKRRGVMYWKNTRTPSTS